MREKREGRELEQAKRQAAAAKRTAAQLEAERKPLAAEILRLDKLMFGTIGSRAKAKAKAKTGRAKTGRALSSKATSGKRGSQGPAGLEHIGRRRI